MAAPIPTAKNDTKVSRMSAALLNKMVLLPNDAYEKGITQIVGEAAWDLHLNNHACVGCGDKDGLVEYLTNLIDQLPDLRLEGATPRTDVFTRTYVSFWKQTEAEKTKELVYVLWILPKDGRHTCPIKELKKLQSAKAIAEREVAEEEVWEDVDLRNRNKQSTEIHQGCLGKEDWLVVEGRRLVAKRGKTWNALE